MIVWKLTLSQFLSKELKETGETAIPVEQFLAAALHPPYWYEGAEVELESHPGFATAPAKRPGMPLSLEYQVLLQKIGIRMDARRRICGRYRDGGGSSATEGAWSGTGAALRPASKGS